MRMQMPLGKIRFFSTVRVVPCVGSWQMMRPLPRDSRQSPATRASRSGQSLREKKMRPSGAMSRSSASRSRESSMTENHERLVSSVSFSILRSRVTRYSPMPPMQHDQRSVAVEGHAERPAADMGEDFLRT